MKRLKLSADNQLFFSLAVYAFPVWNSDISEAMPLEITTTTDLLNRKAKMKVIQGKGKL